MLSTGDLDRIAQAHVEAAEAAMIRRDASVRLGLVKLCDMDDPPGAYYSSKLLVPTDGLLLGGGGFFVSSQDGNVQEFGSGELSEACRAENARGWATLEITPAVVRFLLARRAEELASSHRRWWEFWK